jgi:hypothetical protein
MKDSTAGHDAVDADAIYRQIGLFVVAFQSLETELVQICWLTTDPPHAPDGRRALAALSFSGLVTETGVRVDAFLDRRGSDDPSLGTEFRERFHALLSRCRAIARHRNQIVHSAYAHLEGGGQLQGILRSDVSRAADGPHVEFDQELLSATSFDEALHDIAMTAFDLAQSRTQLVHWTR